MQPAVAGILGPQAHGEILGTQAHGQATVVASPVVHGQDTVVASLVMVRTQWWRVQWFIHGQDPSLNTKRLEIVSERFD